MLVKLIGGVLVISASAYLGFALSGECSRRLRDLRALQELLRLLENEIGFLSSMLADAFINIAEGSKSPAALFFESAGRKLESCGGISAAEAWEAAVRDNIGKTALNREDEEILTAFGKFLGSSDVEGQVRNIRYTLTRLKVQEEKAEAYRKKNESLYRNLGMLAGAAIVVLLL